MKLSNVWKGTPASKLSDTVAMQVASDRAKLASNYCPNCKEGMSPFVDGSIAEEGITKWSWFSLWVVACEEHCHWIQAAYDTLYVQDLNKKITDFRAAEQMVARSIELWKRIDEQLARLDAGQLTHDQYEANRRVLLRKLDPGMLDIAPDSLPDCLESIRQDMLQYERDLQLALWIPPVTWRP